MRNVLIVLIMLFAVAQAAEGKPLECKLTKLQAPEVCAVCEVAGVMVTSTTRAESAALAKIVDNAKAGRKMELTITTGVDGEEVIRQAKIPWRKRWRTTQVDDSLCSFSVAAVAPAAPASSPPALKRELWPGMKDAPPPCKEQPCTSSERVSIACDQLEFASREQTKALGLMRAEHLKRKAQAPEHAGFSTVLSAIEVAKNVLCEVSE